MILDGLNGKHFLNVKVFHVVLVVNDEYVHVLIHQQLPIDLVVMVIKCKKENVKLLAQKIHHLH